MAHSRWRTPPDRIGLDELAEALGIAKRTWYSRGYGSDTELRARLECLEEPHGANIALTFDRAVAMRWCAEERTRRSPMAPSSGHMRDRFAGKRTKP